jgi:phage terminase large subunit-like protein
MRHGSGWSAVGAVARSVTEAHRLDPLSHRSWTPPILEWFRDPQMYRCLKTGNGMGKSYAHAAELVWRATGTHPYRRTHRPPVRMMSMSVSEKQRAEFHRAIWESLDPSQVRCTYVPGKGFTGRPAVIEWIAGPGKGSTLTFGTYNASSQGIAGGTLHYIGFDEPFPELLWGEAVGRGRGVYGEIGITITPTPEAPPQVFLRDLCMSGEVSLTEALLKPENLMTEAGYPIDDWRRVERQIAQWLPLERQMRQGIGWEVVLEGAVLNAFRPELVRAIDFEDIQGWRVGVGIDHGAGAGRQRAVLVAHHATGSRDEFRVLGESYSDGRTTPQQDARGILEMLEGFGMGPEHVDKWIGDRSHAGDKRGGKKSNQLLVAAFADLLGVSQSKLPRQLRKIWPPRKFDGSVWHGCRVLNAAMLSDRLLFSDQCERLLDDIKAWRGLYSDPHKDGVDAMRYIVVGMAESRRRRAA